MTGSPNALRHGQSRNVRPDSPIPYGFHDTLPIVGVCDNRISTNQCLKEEALLLREENVKLEANNAVIIKNTDDDSSPDKFKRSPPTIFNKVAENSFTPTSNKPIQGGLIGLGKKK